MVKALTRWLLVGLFFASAPAWANFESQIKSAEALLADGSLPKVNSAITLLTGVRQQLPASTRTLESALISFRLGEGYFKRFSMAGDPADRNRAITAFTSAEATFRALGSGFFASLAQDALKQLR